MLNMIAECIHQAINLKDQKENSKQTVNMAKATEKSLQQELAEVGETLQAMQQSHSQLQQQNAGQENQP
eukprot:3136249-Ditylum_brightwellii.AAC.1